MWLRADAATKDLGDLVREHPDLTPAEKETTIRFGKDEDRATIYIDEAGVGRRLLAHPRADVKDVNILEDGGTLPVAPSEVAGREIVGVRVSIPVGGSRSGCRRARRAATRRS